MGYFDGAEVLIDDDNIKYSGICFGVPDFTKYLSQCKTLIITSRLEYRPDKIAWDLYGDDNLGWVIDEINGAMSPEFYILGKEVKYLLPSILSTLGVL